MSTTTFPLDLLRTILDGVSGLSDAELQARLQNHVLSSEHVQRLSEIAEHFLGPQPPSPPSPSQHELVSRTQDPWRVFNRLTALSIPGHLQSILNSGARQFVSSDRSAAPGNSLLSSSLRKQQESVQHLQRLFMLLALFDLIMLHFPGTSGCRLSKPMKNKLRPHFSETDIEHGYPLGRKLHEFCRIFSPGCLFYFEDLLSDNLSVSLIMPLAMMEFTDPSSLLHKFTKSGQSYEVAVPHLRSLGVVQLAQESGADVFATDARDISKMYLKIEKGLV